MIVFQVLSLIIWLLLVPLAIGLLPASLLNSRRQKPGVILLFGYLIMFAAFELIAIPVVLTVNYHGMTVLSSWFTVTTLGLAVAGMVSQAYVRRKTGKPLLTLLYQQPLDAGQRHKISLEEKIVWLIFLLLVGFQLYMAFTRASFDGDDAYYVVQSLTAQQQDVLYRREPDTGISTILDMRHALAVFPLWLSFIAVKSDIHATIVAHSIIPLILLPLSYLLYFQIGMSLLGRKRDMLPMFMVIMALIQMFGNVSIYTNETFLMTRTWQGKSFASNFILPAVLWLFLWIFEDNTKENTEGNIRASILWILLGAANWAAGMSSSMAVFLTAMLSGAFGFFMMIRKRKFMILVKTGLACIPSAIYVLLYMFLS